MTSTTAKSAPPQPSFHYETTMASRRAFQQPNSSAWALANADVAKKFLASSGWKDSPAPSGTAIDPSAKGPTLLHFWCFYGVVGLVAQGFAENPGGQHWFTAEGTPAAPGTWVPAGDLPPQFTNALVESIADLSRQVPTAYLRIDLTVGAAGSRVSGFAPKPVEASRLNAATDRRLGQLTVDAAGRLHHDLVTGKQFTAFTAALGRTPGEIASDVSAQARATRPTAGASASMPITTPDAQTTSATPPKNYATWKLPHFSWQTVDEFVEAAKLEDGVHSVILPSGICVDAYIAGQPFASTHNRPVLTFFAGAVTGRETKIGPFFTGLGIAKALGAPLISIADPTLDSHRELGLAWFTGRQNERVDDGITSILESLAERANRELLLVGGSGGGFAALKFAARLGSNCSAFVWNAQTDLLKYSPRFVRNYLSLAMGFSQSFLRNSEWIEASRGRMEPGISTTVLRPGDGLRPRRLFYLQNADDWHVGSHFIPWAEANGFRNMGDGVAAADPDHAALVAHAAPGHQPPPTPLVTDIIRYLQAESERPLDLARALLEQEPSLSRGLTQIPGLDPS